MRRDMICATSRGRLLVVDGDQLVVIDGRRFIEAPLTPDSRQVKVASDTCVSFTPARPVRREDRKYWREGGRVTLWQFAPLAAYLPQPGLGGSSNLSSTGRVSRGSRRDVSLSVRTLRIAR